uniref:Uncharacterized protein n=1 Tax=Cacopsylla melanoneura TaxID=428564 RepID=A0A8D8VYQ8_9HEMI
MLYGKKNCLRNDVKNKYFLNIRLFRYNRHYTQYVPIKNNIFMFVIYLLFVIRVFRVTVILYASCMVKTRHYNTKNTDNNNSFGKGIPIDLYALLIHITHQMRCN